MPRYLYLIILLFLFACNENETSYFSNEETENILLDKTQANYLASLPLKCMQVEYPNKTSQVLTESGDLGTPKDLHPAFYGCFDWHSAVHGHWSLVELLKRFPDLEDRELMLQKLGENLSLENIEGEIAYFNRPQEYSYERMYGWAWLLKLQEALDSWDLEEAKEWSKSLQGLSDIIIDRYIEFLPKLNYPLRVGTHNNTAFGLNFAYDYAVHAEHSALKQSIETHAKRLFKEDLSCPIEWEPDGFDFLSPCLEELALMQRVLPKEDFKTWANSFLPSLSNKDFDLSLAKVSDRTDGHLVHLDGLNFSRAWVLYRMVYVFPEEYGHLKTLADEHLAFSLPAITDGNYEGEHWLASFALYALTEKDLLNQK